MRKILITGTSGFIGKYLAISLSKNKNNKIIALDRNKTLFEDKNIKQIVVDLKSKNIKFPRNIDIVIHLAAFNGTKYFYKKPFDVINDNIISTLNLLNYFKNRKLKKFIYAGTPESFAGATEHFNYKIPTDENCPFVVPDPKNLRWSYGNSKALGEQAVIASGIPYTILRYFNVYGPGQKDHFISEFYNKIKKNKFELEGYNNTRTFLYIDDAVKATELLINNRKSRNQISNIGGEQEIKIKYVAKLIMKLSKIKGNLKYLSHPEGSVLRRCPDISKIKKIVKFKVKTNLEDGLIKTLKI